MCMNEYDSQTRMYYTPIMRTTTMDSMAGHSETSPEI